MSALLDAADQLGVGPVVLFDPPWYRARHQIPADAPAFLHYLQTGAASGFDPHPLFSVHYYAQQAPDAAGHALLDFLQRGGPAGLDCHPLFSSEWYRQANPDVAAADMIPIVHYLQWGASEGRTPHPLFCVPHYLRQADDPAANSNPLLHFVQHGEAAGLSPHPNFRPDRVAAAFKAARADGPIRTYLDLIGLEQPARAARLAAPQPDPPLQPPPLPRQPRPAGAATLAGVALNARFGLGAPGSAYCLAKLQAMRSDPGTAADFAAAIVQPDGPTMPELIAAALLLPAAQPLPPGGDPGTDIPSRAAALHYAAAARFRLDPAAAGTALTPGPLISILLPVYRTPLALLERAILSVLCQTYPRWQLCIVDDASANPALAAALARFAAADRRITLHPQPSNAGIAAASNRALQSANGDYIGLLDHDDMLTADALDHIARALLAQPAPIDLLYSDECLLDADDLPVRLFPKPDWSPALLTSFMYTGHFSVYRAALVRELGGFRGAFDFSQDYDLALRVAERDPAVIHVREILYGWRQSPGSAAAGGKPEARRSNVAALQDALDRRSWNGTALELHMSNRVVRRLDPQPLVSLVIPSDDPKLIAQTIMSVVAHTSWTRYEILVVARDAVIAACRPLFRPGSVRFVPYNAPFNFSAKCNAGAAAARGEHLLFLNDDVRVITPDWIDAILEALTLPGVGAVAPKLLYADNTIQHAGMVTGTRRLVTTAFHTFPHATPAHFNLAQSLREVSLLSGACLAVPATLFRRLGGFDAAHAPIAHSDVDFCLRLRAAGYRCLYTPHATLTHLGHQSIGAAERPFRRDKADIVLMTRWGKHLEQDPYFPPAMRDLLLWGDSRPFRFWSAPHRPPNRNGDALLASHDLSASGAPKIVWDMARVLIGAGRHVLVMAAEDGPFRDQLLALGADVIIEPDLLAAPPPVIELARNFDLVVCNTVLCWRLLPALRPFTSVFLYAHETGLVTQTAAAEPGFAAALAEASGLWAGSERAAAALRACGLDPLILEYGVAAPTLDPAGSSGRDLVIATLATIEPRKGQDLAIKAFPLLPAHLRQRCRLVMHGRPHDLPFAEAIQALVGPDERIAIGPELDRDQYRRALAAADIVLCPSRDDTLPIVSLDALAAGKILVVSQDVGTAAYLEDGVSGFILPHNHPEAIAATLARIIAQRHRWPAIAKAAQRVFRNNFSEWRFAERLLALVDERATERHAAD